MCGPAGQMEPAVLGAQASGLSANIEFVMGEVGEGGDHMNVGSEMVTVSGDEIVVNVDNLVKKQFGGTKIVCAVVKAEEKLEN